MSETPSPPPDSSDLGHLLRKVEDLETALEAIRSGDVDVLVVGTGGHNQLYSQTPTDQAYQMLVEQMAAAMATLSPAGRILFANQRLAEWLYCAPAALVGRPLLDLVVEADRPRLLQLQDSAARPRSLALSLLRSDGEAVPVLVALDHLEMGGKRLDCLVAIAQTGPDRCSPAPQPGLRIPTRRGPNTATAPARQSQLLLPLALAQLGLFLVELAWQELVLLPMYWVPVVLSSAFAAPRQLLLLTLSAVGFSLLTGLRWSLFAGVDYWMHLLAMGLVTLASLVVVHQRRIRERLQQESEQQFRLLAENASDVVFRASLAGVTEWISPSVTALLARTPEEMIGRPFGQFVHPADLETLARADAAFARGERRNVRLRVRHGQQGYRWVAVNARGLLDPQGRVRGIVGGWRDVQTEMEAEQNRARDRARDRARLLATFASLLDPHVVLAARRNDAGTIVDFVYTEANQAACRYNLLQHDQLIGRSVLELLPAHKATGLLEMYTRVIETGEPLVLDGFTYPHEILGEERRFDIRAVPMGDELSYTWRDVTERDAAAQRLAASEDQFRLLASNATDVVIRSHDGINTWTSPSVTEMLGWQPEEWVGHPLADLVHPQDLDAYRSALRAVERGERVIHRCRLRSREGRWHWIQAHAGPYLDQQGRLDGQVASIRVIDDQVAAEQLLQHQARTDELTGLLNRREVLTRIEHLAAPDQRRGAQTALLFCDLDRFKEVNDRYGHAAGDELLTAIAVRIRACLRRQDLAARVGGDELLVVLQNVQSLENAVTIAEMIRAAVIEPVATSAGEVQISLSIGVTLMIPGEGTDALMARADGAMYDAKRLGRNRVIPIATPAA